MHFANAMTRATTAQDRQLLEEVTFGLRSLFIIGILKREAGNKKWKVRTVDCHAIARMLSIVLSECTLVDGLLYGLRPVGNGKWSMFDTCHSWLVTPDGAIIDPYPMGIIAAGSALLIPTQSTSYSPHGSNLYEENPEVKEHFDVDDSWKRARSYVRILHKNMNAHLERTCTNYITDL